MAVMDNSSLLFSSCHLKLVILGNNRLLLENSQLFVKITSKKSTIFEITSSRRLEENNRLLFSVTGINDQDLSVANKPILLQCVGHIFFWVALVSKILHVRGSLRPLCGSFKGFKVCSATSSTMLL